MNEPTVPGPGKATLFRKMALVLGEIQRVPKSGMNRYFNYAYATESDLLDVVRPALAKHGVAFFVTCIGSEVIPTNGAKQGDITRVEIEATFGCGETGETVTVRWFGDGQDNADKGLNKAYTAAVKYLLAKTFLMSSGEDPDDGPAGDQPAEARPMAHPAAPVPKPTPAPKPAPKVAPSNEDVPEHLRALQASVLDLYRQRREQLGAATKETIKVAWADIYEANRQRLIPTLVFAQLEKDKDQQKEKLGLP